MPDLKRTKDRTCVNRTEQDTKKKERKTWKGQRERGGREESTQKQERERFEKGDRLPRGKKKGGGNLEAQLLLY